MEAIQDFIQSEIEQVDSMVRGNLSLESYISHYQELTEQQKSIAAYLLAMGGKSSGHGFMRSLQADRDVKYPFMFCGWAGKHSNLGPMFQINKECFFMDSDPVLFYTDDDLIYSNSENLDDIRYLAEQIKKYSIGVNDIKVQMLTMYGMSEPVLGITFRLYSEFAENGTETDRTSAKVRNSSRYILAVPKVGEYECVLGNVSDSGCVNLHYDNFCMK